MRKVVLSILTASLFLASCGTSSQEENVGSNVVTDTTTVDTTTTTDSVEDTASLN